MTTPERPCALVLPSGDVVVAAPVLVALCGALRRSAPLRVEVAAALRVFEVAARDHLDRVRERCAGGSSAVQVAACEYPEQTTGGLDEVTVAEAAAQLGISPQAVRRACGDGRLVARRVRLEHPGRPRRVQWLVRLPVVSATGAEV